MSGPFSLRYVHMFATNRSPGAFILSKNGRAADFVGSSPDDLPAALVKLARGSLYRFFWFTYTSSSQEAAHLEHTWIHRYHPTDNPTAPPGLHVPAWRCTVKGCASCAISRARP